VYAIYPNGTEKWHFDTEWWIYYSPAIGDDGTIYIGSNDGYLYALYPNGSLRWRYKTGDCVQSSPAIDNDGTIYVGSWDSYLYALSPDGSLKWRYKTTAAIDDSSPALYGNSIYVGSYDGYLYALRSDGSLRWKFKTGTSIIASPAVDSNGIVYISSMDGKLYALNPDGSLRWNTPMLSDKPHHFCYLESSPAIGADGTIYVGSWFGNGGSWGYLHAIRDGTPKGIEIVKPADGGLYLFNLKLLDTQSTYVIGGIRVKTDVISPEQVERVEFSVDGEHRYTDTTPPFTWRWNDRAFKIDSLFELHHLSVTAHYNDGDVVASQYRNALILNPLGRPTLTTNDNEATAPPYAPFSPDMRYASPRELAGRLGFSLATTPS
jgi:outer membrane protein assembly factor BamB